LPIFGAMIKDNILNESNIDEFFYDEERLVRIQSNKVGNKLSQMIVKHKKKYFFIQEMTGQPQRMLKINSLFNLVPIFIPIKRKDLKQLKKKYKD
jgi:hypothetical protein